MGTGERPAPGHSLWVDPALLSKGMESRRRYSEKKKGKGRSGREVEEEVCVSGGPNLAGSLPRGAWS